MNKNAKLGAAVALAGAAGVFAASRKKKAQTVKQTRKQQQELADYRNTERGMHEKNSKGIYYSNGNYYYGRYKNNERLGFGAMFFTNNTITIQYWKGKDE